MCPPGSCTSECIMCKPSVLVVFTITVNVVGINVVHYCYVARRNSRIIINDRPSPNHHIARDGKITTATADIGVNVHAHNGGSPINLRGVFGDSTVGLAHLAFMPTERRIKTPRQFWALPL